MCRNIRKLVSLIGLTFSKCGTNLKGNSSAPTLKSLNRNCTKCRSEGPFVGFMDILWDHSINRQHMRFNQNKWRISPDDRRLGSNRYLLVSISCRIEETIRPLCTLLNVFKCAIALQDVLFSVAAGLYVTDHYQKHLVQNVSHAAHEMTLFEIRNSTRIRKILTETTHLKFIDCFQFARQILLT